MTDIINQKTRLLPFIENKTNYTSPVIFKAESKDVQPLEDENNSLERVPQKDVFEKNKNESKLLTKETKWIIGLSLGAVAIGIAAKALKIRNLNKLKQQTEKLFKDKIKLSKFDKNIEFKEASTVEEGINFAKNVLGIKEVDSDISLEAINSLNRDFVNAIKKNNGEMYMPKAIRYRNFANESISAEVKTYIQKDDFLELFINKKDFDRDYLIKHINDFGMNRIPIFLTRSKKFISSIKYGEIKVNFEPDLLAKIHKYQADPNSLNIDELREIFYTCSSLSDLQTIKKNSPRTFIDLIVKFSKSHTIDMDVVNKMDDKKVVEYLADYIKQNNLEFNFPTTKSSSILFHELGHINDLGYNIKKNIMISGEINEFAYLDMIMTKSKYNKLSEQEKTTYLSELPIFREFIEDKEIQRIAGNVSEYATAGKGEFVAEVYAGLLNGVKYSDEIMNLYKKYNGPLF